MPPPIPKVPVKTVQVYTKQQAFLQSPALLRAFVGGIGTGKSFIGALDMIKRAEPGRLYLVTAPTYPMLSDATFRSLTNLAIELRCVAAADVKSSAPPSIKLRNGAEILFRSTDNPDMLRGPNMSGIWMDEASLSKREAFDVLIGRLREGGKMGWLTATFTPKGKTHWTYKMFGTGGPDTFLVHAASSENPFLPKEFVSNVRRQYTKRQADQELEGLFLDGGGNHYFPTLWPRYADVGDAYRVWVGGRMDHVRKVDCSRLLALDWAMGKPPKGGGEPKGDHTAFVVADITPDGILLLLHVFNDKVILGENAKRLAEVCRRWHPEVVVGDNDNLSEAMLLETKRQKDIPTVRCMSIGGRNKLVRSQSAIVRAERGMIQMPESGRASDEWIELIEDQLGTFSGADGAEDDIADCISILGRMADEFVPGEDSSGEDEAVLGSTGYEGGVW